MSVEKKYEDHEIKIEIKEGILWASFKDNIINKDMTSKMIRERIRLSDCTSYPVIMSGVKMKYWTMSSRNDPDMKKLGFHLIDFSALVLSSKPAAILWNYAASMMPIPITIKVFFDVKLAEHWVKQEMKNRQLTTETA